MLPPFWALSTYFAEGFPYSLVRQLSTVFFKDFGASLQAVQFDSTLQVQKGAAQVLRVAMDALPSAPYATLLALQRAAQGPAEAFALPDGLWARVVFDFAVAHLSRAVERRQLLRSFTPLYMGWLAGLAQAAATFDDVGFEACIEATAVAFEREKRYLISRWRWPDGFNP